MEASSNGQRVFRNRHPAVPVAVCFAFGILLDRSLPQMIWWAWAFLTFIAAGFVIWGAVRARRPVIVLGLFGAIVFLGGMRHHAFWSLDSIESVSHFFADEPRLVRLRGIVTEPPIVKAQSETPFNSAYRQSDTTVLTLRCRSLQDGTRFVPVRGKVQVRIDGNLPYLKTADAIEVFGWAARPTGPANPGDFDYREYLRQQQIHSVVRVQVPEAVTKLPEASESGWSKAVDELRSRAERFLAMYLSEENAEIAAALLLGSRASLPEEVRLEFIESGMMHVLALSGLHVGILAGLVWCLCRLAQLPPRVSALVMFASVLGLAVISGGRPPIVRAAVFLGIASFGRLASRQSSPQNIIALSALVILAWNPTDLFAVGAQLSFLGVMGILLTTPWLAPPFDPNRLADDESKIENRFLNASRILGRLLWQYWRLTVGISLLILPLAAARFHVISLIGLLLNVLMFPFVTLVLSAGFLLMFAGWSFPWMAPLLAVPFDAGLSVLLSLVKWGAGLPLGHLDVAGPPDWWLAGYYSLFAGLYYFRDRIARPRFLGTVLILSWTAFGLAVSAWPTSPRGLRATFLSVGHGSAILLEFPGGKTLLFDGGALDNGERAFRVVRGALWRRGITHLDAVVISHSDLDHINAVPQIAKEIPVGQVFVARSFLKSSHEVVPHVVKTLAKQNIPIRAVGTGDRLILDPLVSADVLHPDPQADYAHNNANSLVIGFQMAGRRLLLTGDVELEGLDDLMNRTRWNIDVLQSPHHGSPTANTPELVRWANPRVVVVSGGFVAGRTEQLEKLYGSQVRLLSTVDDGAVAIEITPEGHLLVESVRQKD